MTVTLSTFQPYHVWDSDKIGENHNYHSPNDRLGLNPGPPRLASPSPGPYASVGEPHMTDSDASG
jgi:hypothetical protein